MKSVFIILALICFSPAVIEFFSVIAPEAQNDPMESVEKNPVADTEKPVEFKLPQEFCFGFVFLGIAAIFERLNEIEKNKAV